MRLFATLVCLLVPALAGAQSATRALPRYDTAVSIGWQGMHYPVGDYRSWQGSVFVGLGGAHYWNDHQRTEVEAAWLSPVRVSGYTDLVHNGIQTYAISSHRFQDARFSMAHGYQFGRNAWVHPFVAAGADVHQRRTVEERVAQTRPIYTSDRTFTTVSIPLRREDRTEMWVEPFAKAGLKMYVSDRRFVVTELKFGWRSGLDQVLWKTGIGFDF